MRFEIDNSIAVDLNEKAESLVKTLSLEGNRPKDPESDFRANYFVPKASLKGDELPSLPIQSVIGLSGDEVARFFPDITPSVGLSEDNYREFLDLIHTVGTIKAFSEQISLTFISDSIFYWLKQRHLGNAIDNTAAFITKRCSESVASQDVWIPIERTKMELKLDMGNGWLRDISKEVYRRWVTEWHARNPSQVTPLADFLESIGGRSSTVFTTTVTAEPIKAVEAALDRAETALVLLRYFSPANFEPTMFTLCTVSGTEHVDRPRHLLLQDGLVTSAGLTEFNLRWQNPWKISADLVSGMKDRGLDTLIRLNRLDRPERSEFQNALIEALTIYSRSSLAQSLNDKLLYAVVSLETILLKDGSEPLQKNVSDRMAMLVGRSLSERQFIIKDYKEAYRSRSTAVHHGAVIQRSESIARFLRAAWLTFSKLIENVDRFETKAETLEWIDDSKFR